MDSYSSQKDPVEEQRQRKLWKIERERRQALILMEHEKRKREQEME